jgi:hypothetical protein
MSTNHLEKICSAVAVALVHGVVKSPIPVGVERGNPEAWQKARPDRRKPELINQTGGSFLKSINAYGRDQSSAGFHLVRLCFDLPLYHYGMVG